MIRDRTAPAKDCTCDICGATWTMYDDQPLPTWCRNQACRSRKWNGEKQQVRSHVHEIKLPAPRTGGRPTTKAAARSVTLFEEEL